MSMFERFVRRVAYPLHERLCRRPTLRCYDEMSRFATASPTEVQEEAARRLRALLSFLARELPYYRQRFETYRVNLEGDDPYAELAKLPLLSKADVRTHADRMVYKRVSGGLIPCGSGGTTGDTLRFFVDRARQAQPLGCRLLMQSLFGVRLGHRRVYLWGSPIEARAPWIKRWRDRLLNELLLSAFDMSPARMDAQLAAIRSFLPRLLYAYPSAAALLARHAARRFGPADFPWLKLVVLTGEEITPDQVGQIRETFGCPAVSEYGSREVGLIAHECPHGGLHVMSPYIHVEVMSDGRPAEVGQVGEVVCTTLTTRGQPFVRYRLGDLAVWEPGSCSCGLPFPRMQLVGGRTSGFVALPDGRLCYGSVSSCVLRDEPGIVEFKTYQRALDRFELLLVVDDRFEPAAMMRIQQRYRKLFGPGVYVECRVVQRIPPDPSGKRRHVVSDIAPSCARFELIRPTASNSDTATMYR